MIQQKLEEGTFTVVRSISLNRLSDRKKKKYRQLQRCGKQSHTLVPEELQSITCKAIQQWLIPFGNGSLK